METFKFIKGKYTNEKVVADSGVIKAVLSNGTDVTDSVNDETFQTAAFASDNVSGKEIKVYTLRESLSNINPAGEVTDSNTVSISSLGVTESPSGVVLPEAAATELSRTSATATLLNEISWNINSGSAITNVNVNVGKATVGKPAKFTILGNVSVKKFVKASDDLSGKTVYTEENLNTSGSNGTGYYNDGRKCVAIEAYKTEEQVTKTPNNLGNGTYYNLVVSSQNGWKLGINRSGGIGYSITDGASLQDSFNINNADFGKTISTVKVSAWQVSTTNAGTKVTTTYTKKSEVTVKCDPTVYYKGLRLPTGSCFDINGDVLNTGSDLTNIDTVYKEKRNVTFEGTPYKYDSSDIKTYYTYESSDTVSSSSENCNISNNTLTPNQTPFTKVDDENSIYLNARVDNVKKTVEFQ